MGLRYRIIFRIISWLHALVIFWCFYPLAVCLFWPEEPEKEKFCMTGILLLLPIILSWYAVRKLKSLILYLGTGLAASVCYGILNGTLCSALGLDDHRGAVFSVILSLLLFLIRGQGKQKEESVFLDVPMPLHWLSLAIHYVLGALYKVPFYWHMAFKLFLLDAFLCFVFRFFGGFCSFLEEHSHSAGLPVETMRKVSGVIFCCGCMVLFLFVLPALLYGKTPISSLSFDEKTSSREKMEAVRQEETVRIAENAALSERLSGMGEMERYEPPGWLVFASKIITFLICISGGLTVLILICRACRNAGDYFASGTEDEICFLEKETHGRNRRPKKEGFSRHMEMSANMRIRRLYKKLLHRGMKETLTGSETPTELEEKAGLAGNENRLLLHAFYEKARYSGEGCSEEEAVTLKKIMKSGGNRYEQG